jgi:hypothetical protein
MALNTISCVNSENDISFNPHDYRGIDNPRIKCRKCGETNPLTDPLIEDDLQAPDDLE